MRTLTLVLAVALAAWSFAVLPAASAIPPPCVVGGDWESDCLVYTEPYNCVQEPCNAYRLCTRDGLFCIF